MKAVRGVELLALSAALASAWQQLTRPRPGDFSPLFEPIAHVTQRGVFTVYQYQQQ